MMNEMRYVEATDAYVCRHCGEMHLTSSQAGACCGGDATTGGDYVDDAYTCTKCGMVSDNLDDVRGYRHE